MTKQLTPQEKAAITRAKNKAEREGLAQEGEDPIITTIGIFKTGSGWRFTKLQTQGDVVVNREETDHDTLRAYCFDELKVQAIKTFMGDTY